MVLKFFCKIGENTTVLQFSSGFFSKISNILRHPGGSAPGPPTRPDPLFRTPRIIFLRTALLEMSCRMNFMKVRIVSLKKENIFGRSVGCMAGIYTAPTPPSPNRRSPPSKPGGTPLLIYLMFITPKSSGTPPPIRGILYKIVHP